MSDIRIRPGFPFRPCVRLAAALAALLVSACGPRFSPYAPGLDPADSNAEKAVEQSAESGFASPEEQPSAAPGADPAPVRRATAQPLLIGEMCPRGAGGRPAVMPLFLRSTLWSIDGDDVSLPIEQRTARSFSVLSWDGRRAGVFSIAGAADIGLDRSAAIGAYAGDSPCALPGTGETRSNDPACERAQAGCGLAVAVVEAGGRPYEEDPDPLGLAVGGACVSGGVLVVDIDGDGANEAYSTASFLDPVRAPAEEVLAVAARGRECMPSFATRRVLAGQNPKHFRGIDLVGVLDLDGDGRKELVVAYHYAERRTWAVYTAASTVARLDLVGEAVPWATR